MSKSNNNNVTELHKGLHLDNSPQEQPKGTYRFGLNAINESGDENFIGNEESNEPCANFPIGYTPIGKVYIGDGNTAIFLVKNDETLSEIGIMDSECNYTTHINADLGFKLDFQIDATYRLRRGCERTIYFVAPKPMIYNFDRPENFQDSLGNWDLDKFSLFKTYHSIPTFENIEILNLGQLAPGSYNFAIQYLDEDLNPTEWINTSDTIIIYNDNSLSGSFSEIRGSTNKKSDYQDFGNTNKAIKLTINNLDTDFLYYRIAAIGANSGSGLVNKVEYSQVISTKINSYTYTGGNAYSKGTEEEIQQFRNVIASSEHIEQIENRLLLLNTKGEQINWCNLQKYASKIRADLEFKEITLNDISLKDNQKRGQVHFEDVGYMPGEIYSFGIVYVFEDGTLSPVYHIPGRNPAYVSQMSSNNTLTNTNYINNNNNNPDENYWGVDSEGIALNGTPVRHHRFPLRSEVGKPLYVKSGNNTLITVSDGKLIVTISNSIATGYPYTSVMYRVNYTVDGLNYTADGTVNVAYYDSTVGQVDTIAVDVSGTISPLITVQEYDQQAGKWMIPSSGLDYSVATSDGQSYDTLYDSSKYTAEIFGINFSNIDKPSLQDTGGKKVVGYHIVRNERTEDKKTILDTGVLAPLVREVGDTTGTVKFASHGLLEPNIAATGRIQEDTFALIHPDHKFLNREYKNITTLVEEGEYSVNTTYTDKKVVKDVQPGTSYDPNFNTKKERDTNGYELWSFNRTSILDYTKLVTPIVIANNTEIKEAFYLNSLFSKSVDTGNSTIDIYNLSADNKIGIIQLNKSLALNNKLPYVVMKRDLSNPYSEFRVLPYYKETDNYIEFVTDTGNSTTVFNGDSYISPMRYTSSMFYDIREKNRGTKSGIWEEIIGGLSIIAGILLIVGGVFTAGTSVTAGIIAIHFGLTQIATGTKKDRMVEVYKNLYEQGLKDTVGDDIIGAEFGVDLDDDTIQWVHDSLSNLWFESNVNMNWRMGTTNGTTDFLDAPTNYSQKQTSQYCIDKLTTVDAQNQDGRLYQGFANAELYEINPDYLRRDKQKFFYHLGLEYDCCSGCIEKFPHRVHYSEQSFQEELSDNYRTFLPNNYRDIEGETGEITNAFRIKNNLFIHTREALWQLPQNIQERVTGDIVSFIGTGSFFSVPPRKILDDNTGNSAGCQHKWSTLKTPYGVFFVSEEQGSIYQFNGQQLKPISAMGMRDWFKRNLTVQYDKNYYTANKKLYPYRDNPSNPNGTGFISVYDSKNERVIFTKKDFIGDGNNRLNNSWTLSYSLKSNPNTWQSWHSYLPSFYIHTPDKFYSWKGGDSIIWRHNKRGSYQNFYGVKYPFIIEYVSLSTPLVTKVWDSLKFITEAKRYNSSFDEYTDERFITFNKALFYNSRQISGILNLVVKDTNTNNEDYLLQQVQNLSGDSIIIDKNEKDWMLNELRDMRVIYGVPMFDRSLVNLQDEYYIDKKVTRDITDPYKDWTQLESFRDKYLVVRLIFDTFDDVKLLFNYSIENEKQSFR